uniref:Uncharacterized protein n=1 Tax=Arundo donax TaxID=35708 RepID=A0A0A9ENJ0_ARUDO
MSMCVPARTYHENNGCASTYGSSNIHIDANQGPRRTITLLMLPMR